jgi:hypothetical protein
LPLTLFLACAGAPTDALAWRETWELLALPEDGGALDVRATVGNTGLLRGQGHLRVDRWFSAQTPIPFGRDVAPEDVRLEPERRGVALGPDRLGWTGTAWQLVAETQDALARVELLAGATDLPRSAWLEGGGQWTVEAAVPLGQARGLVSTPGRGGLLEGFGVLLHRGGDGVPEGPREAAFVLGPQLSLAIDRQGQGQLAWAIIRGRRVDASDATLSIDADGTALVDFRPTVNLAARIRPRGPPRQSDAHAHLLLPERWAARGFPSRRSVRRGLAEVSYEGTRLETAALLLHVR